MLYERVFRDYYLNKNFYINNRNILPNDDANFRVNNLGAVVSNTDSGSELVSFGMLHYRDYPQDYFTSADSHDNLNHAIAPADKVTADSLADYMGLPIGATYAQLIASGVSCLPFMMYERVFRDYYLNKNFYINNRNILPNDDANFRVNNLGAVVSNTDTGSDLVSFGMLHYRVYPQDYFTSALPWPQRGTAPTLPIGIESGTAPSIVTGKHARTS